MRIRNFYLLTTYETRIFFGLDVFQYQTCVNVGHDTDTCNYIELYYFLKYYLYQSVNVHVVSGVRVYVLLDSLPLCV
jgi:hypothetical protein